VNLVQPGPIDTEMNPADGVNAPTTWTHGARSLWHDSKVAGVVALLASPAASLVTGSIVTADGGANA
jgi:NAD(P)-dependent dehydrogenase (short-subunit alcohol dehydrogenase family)